MYIRISFSLSHTHTCTCTCTCAHMWACTQTHLSLLMGDGCTHVCAWVDASVHGFMYMLASYPGFFKMAEKKNLDSTFGLDFHNFWGDHDTTVNLSISQSWK